MLLASLFLVPALAAIGPSCKDNTWSLVFFRAEGDLYTGRDCTGAATSSCPFPATPETWGSIGPLTGEVGVRCLSASTYSIVAGLTGMGDEVDGPFATSTCVAFGIPDFATWSVKMSCKPGLLIFAVPVACVLVIVGCVCCCRACCCRPQAPPAAKAAVALVAVMQQQPQQQPLGGFYGGPLPPPQWGGYAPPSSSIN